MTLYLPSLEMKTNIIFVTQNLIAMSLPTNDKKGNNQGNKNNKNQGKGSSFIKGSSGTKPAAVTKKVRSTGANRGS